jgi:hypothetical protein
MADTDMSFPAGTIDRLIAAGKPVVGGLCWSLAGGEKLPTIYELAEADGEQPFAFRRYSAWPEDTVMRVSATGAACLLIHRDALVTVEKTSRDRAAPWFRETAVGPMALMGEDMTFCLRCAAAGIPVHVHTGVKTGHMKAQMLI